MRRRRADARALEGNAAERHPRQGERLAIAVRKKCTDRATRAIWRLSRIALSRRWLFATATIARMRAR
jgi:hypothetical protein